MSDKNQQEVAMLVPLWVKLLGPGAVAAYIEMEMKRPAETVRVTGLFNV